MGQEITHADVTADIIERTAKARVRAVAKQVNYRIPFYLLAKVDAMALQAGKSRNAMLNRLLQDGIEHVAGLLSPETLEAISRTEASNLAELLDGDCTDQLDE
jgi:hypothetical protein